MAAAIRIPLVSDLALRTTLKRVGLGCGVVVIALAINALHDAMQDAPAPPPIVLEPPAPRAARDVAPPVVETPAPTPVPEPPHREVVPAPKTMPAALRTGFDSWLMASYAKCWRAPRKNPDAEPYSPKVRVAFRADGSLAEAPKLINPPSDPASRSAAKAAVSAVKSCDPLHVPDKYSEYYPAWKSRTVYFDPARN